MPEYINTETGEVLDSTAPRIRLRRAPSKYVGLDTKWPDDCTTEDSLLETLYQLDDHIHHKPNISYAYITEAITEKLLSVSEAALLLHFSKELTGWNYWMGNRGTLAESLPDMRVRRILQSLLDKGLVRTLHNDKPFKNDLVLKLSPAISFRGGHDWRDTAISRWYAPAK